MTAACLVSFIWQNQNMDLADPAQIILGELDYFAANFHPEGGPRERTITYEAPFDQCDREQDYATVWKEFERRTST